MSSSTSFAQSLIAVETEAGQQAWKTFLFNVQKVRELTEVVDSTTAQQILQAGMRWAGGGWNTTTASRALHDLCGVPLVSSQFDAYRDSWIYGCALHWKVDIPEFSLSELSAAAAFAVASVCAGELEREQDGEDEDDPEDTGLLTEKKFPWEEVLQPLPTDLQVLWRRFGHGEERFELRS